MSSLWRAVCGAIAITACFSSSGALAAQPVDVAREMDRYIHNPRSPDVYRALAGLGDPHFGLDGDAPHDWQDAENTRKLFGLEWGGACRIDYALRTYRERASKLGSGHFYVNQWVKVQRAIFSACTGWNSNRTVQPLPPALAIADPVLATLQRADRAYQVASKLFYISNEAQARTAFVGIAGQRGPHRSAATYMITAIDAGSTADGSAGPNADAVGDARSLLSSHKATDFRAAAHDLIGWIGATADTRETRAAQVAVTLEALHLPLATIRSDPQSRARYDRAATDLPNLWTDFANRDWWLTGAIPERHFGSSAMAQRAKTDRLAAFHLVPRPCRTATCSTAFSLREFTRAREEDSGAARDGDAWRVAAIQNSSDYVLPDLWGEIDRLIAVVGRTPTAYHVALLGLLADEQLYRAFSGVRSSELESRPDRLRGAALMARWPWPTSDWFAERYAASLRGLVNSGQVSDARALRDGVGSRLADEDRWSVPGELVLLLAEDRDHFVRGLVKYDQTSSPLIDRLPIAELVELATDERLAARDRARFARIAWTRSYAIKKRIPKDLDRLMRALNPELATGWRSKIGARTADHALLLDLLRTPGMNLRAASRTEADYDGTERSKLSELDVYEHSLNNWWCGPLAVDYSEREEKALSGALGEGGARAVAEKMLSQSWVWQKLDRKERAALGQRPMAPRLLAEAATVWGERASPRRPNGADEALALAVRATRYGCQMQGGHGRWSKAAWDVLQRRFPDGDAARRTRWWFDCSHFYRRCTDSLEDGQPPATNQEGQALAPSNARQTPAFATSRMFGDDRDAGFGLESAVGDQRRRR